MRCTMYARGGETFCDRECEVHVGIGDSVPVLPSLVR